VRWYSCGCKGVNNRVGFGDVRVGHRGPPPTVIQVRFVRLFGALVIFYGLSYLQFGAVMLYEALQYSGPRRINWYFISANVNIGLLVFVIGIGILLAKEWARILWLMSSIVLLAVQVFLLVMAIVNEQRTALHLVNTLLIVILITISWIKLTRPDVKELFR
jgi:hypothetical protein